MFTFMMAALEHTQAFLSETFDDTKLIDCLF